METTHNAIAVLFYGAGSAYYLIVLLIVVSEHIGKRKK